MLQNQNHSSFGRRSKQSGKKSKSSTLSKEVSYEHFKHLFSDNDAFTNGFVETQVNDNVFMNNNNVEFLDRQICIEEVNIAISSLKNGKSGSVDSLIPELFKVCHNQLAPMLCKLFNYIFDNNIYPEIWRKGIIVPVPKKAQKMG